VRERDLPGGSPGQRGFGLACDGQGAASAAKLVRALLFQEFMLSVKEAAAEFLAKKRVAVTGVSRKPQGHGSNVVYQRLRQRGYEVFAVNPNANQVEGDRCFHDLKAIPGGVDAVVIGTRPESATATMRECADLGIRCVWMHRSFGTGSVSDAAAAWGREHGIRVIDGGCPLMFEPAADPGHKVMRFVCTLTGKVPRRVS
jgi:predicted CoA-binding protein